MVEVPGHNRVAQIRKGINRLYVLLDGSVVDMEDKCDEMHRHLGCRNSGYGFRMDVDREWERRVGAAGY